MLVQSNIINIVESAKRLQMMVQKLSPSAVEIVKSQDLLKSIENSLEQVTALKFKRSTEKVSSANSNVELQVKIASIAYDSNTLFKTILSLPALKGKKITFFKNRDDNHLARNTFTMKQGQIRSEFGNDNETFYVLQDENATYSIVSEKLIEML